MNKYFVSFIAVYAAMGVWINNPTHASPVVNENFGNVGDSYPSSLVFGIDKEFFYGCTPFGGNGLGSIFKWPVSGGGATTIFLPDAITTGWQPTGGLTQTPDGIFHGVMAYGPNGIQDSVFFGVTPSGGYSLGHQYTGDEKGGCIAGDFTLSLDGKSFYTVGACGGGAGNHGVVLKTTPDGVPTVLHTLNGMDGSEPQSAPIILPDGTLVGTAPYGGLYEGGVTYKFDPTYRTTYDFPYLAYPAPKLLYASDGNIYGGLTGGGYNGGLFKMTSDDSIILFPRFENGEYMYDQLIEVDGVLYGVARYSYDGGKYKGKIFRLEFPDSIEDYLNKFSFFHTFDNGNPSGALTLEGGNLYGPLQDGRIFRVILETRLANISTRLRVGIGDDVAIGGFIVTGTEKKKVILRAIGPSLPLTGVLEDPVLELYDATGSLVASNDNWGTSTNKQEITNSGLAPKSASESAILTSLDPGSYTAVLSGVNSGTGIALVEVYDLDSGVDSKLGNISTRGLVQTGDSVMIGGFIIAGTDFPKVVIRAIGPSLASSGVSNTLADPMLEVYDSNGNLLASNDNWKAGGQVSKLQADKLAPSNNAEAALETRLSPGAYTAIVRGANNSTGVALVEVYRLY